jgi:hypothetical protein
MISPHPLDRLVEQDTFAEALALLEPEELIIAALRLEGLSDERAAYLLDIDRGTIGRRMEQARQRIVNALPELAPFLSDRRQRPLRCSRPLQRGWLCPDAGGEPEPCSGRSPDFQHSAPLVRRYIRGLSRSVLDAGHQGQEKGSQPDESPSLPLPERIARASTG